MSAGKKALLLGSGFVATPTVQVLSKAGVHVTVACRTHASAAKLASGFANTSALALDVNDAAALEKAVAAHDVVISLIPYTFHAQVIKAAIAAKRHVVTTSYVSPAMMELDAAAKQAGIVVLNEIGLDPGIDHLYAVRMIDQVHAEGGKVRGFWSYCGGLPAPECSDNPLGYKFSWSSRGVLLALKNEAKFYEAGKERHVSSAELMGTAKPYYTGYMGYAFVAYPNRDSTPYRERYNIPECDDLVRGTLRYAGFPEFIKALVDTGFLSDAAVDYLSPAAAGSISWRQVTARLLGVAKADASDAELVAAIEQRTSFADASTRTRILEGLKWIGLFDAHLPAPAKNTPLDALCATLEDKMQYAPSERDLVFLQHRFLIQLASGTTETRTSTLVRYGEVGGYSAMATTVGVPCGVATLMVLDGRIARKGVVAPLDQEICGPIIDELRDGYGIFLEEKTV